MCQTVRTCRHKLNNTNICSICCCTCCTATLILTKYSQQRHATTTLCDHNVKHRNQHSAWQSTRSLVLHIYLFNRPGYYTLSITVVTHQISARTCQPTINSQALREADTNTKHTGNSHAPSWNTPVTHLDTTVQRQASAQFLVAAKPYAETESRKDLNTWETLW